MSKHHVIAGVSFALFALSSCNQQPKTLNETALKSADQDQGNWLSVRADL